MTRTFKAAYFVDGDSGTGGGLRLTSEDNAHLSDADLIAEAMHEAKMIDLEITEDQISVGDWTE